MSPSVFRSFATPVMNPLPSEEASTEPCTSSNTGPSTALTTPNRSRRGSAVLNTVKGFFFSRKDSVLSKGPPTEPTPDVVAPNPLASSHDRNEADLARAEWGELVYEGRAHIPSEREHFARKQQRQESNGARAGEPSTWYKDTEEWKNRDESPLSPRLPNALTNLEADAAPETWHKLRDHSPEPSGNRWQSRRHSSIREALESIGLQLSRRSPKKKKQGKLPAKKDGDKTPPSPPSATDPPISSSTSMPIPCPPENTPSSSVLPLTRIHCFIPPTSEADELSFELTFEPEEIPHPSYLSVSSSNSSIASKKMTAKLPPQPNSDTPQPRKSDPSPPTPPPGRPDVYPFSSNETLATTSTSMSSLGDSLASTGAHQPQPQPPTLDTPNVVTAFTALAVANAYPPSLPIDIPTPTNPSRRSSNATAIHAGPPHPTLPHFMGERDVSPSRPPLSSEHQSTAPPTLSLAPISHASGVASLALDRERETPASGALPQPSNAQTERLSGNTAEPPSYTRSLGDGEQRLAAGRGVSPALVRL